MDPFVANAAALFVFAGGVWMLALGLLWRVGAWRIPPAMLLDEEEGLRVGSAAPQLAATESREERHLDFSDATAFIVFGTTGCQPCEDLLVAATSHPATRTMRRVYVTNDDDAVHQELRDFWEVYSFVDERAAREMWRAPVSPYFHVVGPSGRVIDKGVASHASHLDKLLRIRPQLFEVGKPTSPPITAGGR